MNIQDIPNMTDAEIEAYLQQGEFHTQGYQFAFQEYNRRKLKQLSKPHWSVIPGFWVAVVAAAAACMTLYFVLRPPSPTLRPDTATHSVQSELVSPNKRVTAARPVEKPEDKRSLPESLQ